MKIRFAFRLAIAILTTSAVAHAEPGSEDAPRMATTTGIDEGAFVEINGVEQWIVIRGADLKNPVLLWVHGGPGGAGGAFATPLFREWEKRYTVVHWDQPGGGATLAKGGAAALENLTIDRFARDGIAVAEHLKRRLRVDKILLMGISWGTIVGVEMAHRRPDLFSAYVGTAQHANSLESRKAGYELALLAARARHDEEGIAALERIGPPPYERVEDFFIRQRYTLGFPKTPIEAAAQAEFTRVVAAPPPPDASYVARGLPVIADGARVFLAVQTATFDQAQRWDPRRLGLEFQVPVFIFHGENDINIPATLTLQYCREIVAPAKACEVIPNAGHNTLAFHHDLLRLLDTHVRPVLRGVAP